MASISFPANPVDGTRLNGYVYDDTLGVWNREPLISTSRILNFSSLVEPADGSILVYDYSTKKWKPELSFVEVGQMFAFAGNNVPDGYLLCDGQNVSRTLYSALFSTIGTTYGSGDGSQTFSLPNLSGRVPIQHNSADSDFNPLGKTAGAKTVTLVTAELPSHTHTQLPHNHIQNQHNHTQDAHNHSFNIQFYPTGWEAGGYGTGYYGSFRGRAMTTNSYSGLGTDARQPAIQNKTATNQNTTATNNNEGGGQGHNNLQPYIVLKYIIKT